jgi:two-component system alkaline phosphatase synthesis response regulator PhoP
MKKILVVDDEKSLLDMLKLNLELEGYGVQTASNGKEALSFLDIIDRFDLVVLDVMMPHFSGLDVCTEIRKKSKVPILFLSAKGASTDRVAGLKLGANDYLSKPFDLEEFLLRVSVISGANAQKEEQNQVQIGELTVDFKTYDVLKSNERVAQLSKREIDLLLLFVEYRGEVVSRNKILDNIWGVDEFPTSRTIDNYILNFRKIFEENPKSPVYFHSVRGVGYKFTPSFFLA